MSGYVPVFESIYDGTLHGKWPTAVVWASILPLCNKDGEIRLTYEAIQARTGWPMKFLKQGISELMQPDPESQSDAYEGRRLIPLDERRSWGWKVVNHSKYREKARKSSHDAKRTESGENAERMKERREQDQELNEKTRRDPPRPDATRQDPLSNTNTNPLQKAGRKRPSKVPPPEGFAMTPELTTYVTQAIPDCEPSAMFAKFMDQAKAGGWVYADWVRAFQHYVRNAAPDSGHFAAGQYPRKVSGIQRMADGTAVRW